MPAKKQSSESRSEPHRGSSTRKSKPEDQETGHGRSDRAGSERSGTEHAGHKGHKFALVGFSEGLRSELEKDGIYVTTVCPGLMRTGSPPNAFFKGKHREEYAWFAISDSLPLLSISARRAAARIVRACRYGDSWRVSGPHQRIQRMAHADPP